MQYGNKLLLVRFPNLGSDDVIVSGMANFILTSNWTLLLTKIECSNVGRLVVKKLAVKFEGNEILSVGDFELFTWYRDL